MVKTLSSGKKTHSFTLYFRFIRVDETILSVIILFLFAFYLVGNGILEPLFPEDQSSKLQLMKTIVSTSTYLFITY